MIKHRLSVIQDGGNRLWVLQMLSKIYTAVKVGEVDFKNSQNSS